MAKKKFKTRRRIPERIPEPDDPRLEDVYLRELEADYFKKVQLQDMEFAAKIHEIMPSNTSLIIDIMCGCGEYAREIAKASPGVDVIGIDNSERAIRHGTEIFQPWPENLALRVGNVFELLPEYQDSDIITSNGSLHHIDSIDDVSRLFSLVYDTLKTPGFFIFEDLRREAARNMELQQYISRLYDWRRTLDQQEFVDRLERERLLDERGISTLTLLSIMAAYTENELKRALDSARFGYKFESKKKVHKCVAYKS